MALCIGHSLLKPMERMTGYDPAVFALEGRRDSQLRYIRKYRFMKSDLFYIFKKIIK